MTAQISDTIRYLDKAFSIVGVSGEGLFNPVNYGIKPVIKSTACYRGFFCTYAVINKYLRLNKVYLGLDFKNSLLIKYGRGGLKLFGQIPHKTINFCGLHQYEGLNKFVNFTGGLLIGSGFIRELSSNAGSSSPYRFEQVIELIFESGQLIQSLDRSKKMSELRNLINFDLFKLLSSAGKEKVQQWIEEGSMPDYGIH